MQEFIAFCEGKWWHFFMKPFYGLCVRKKEGSRFSNFEVLLEDAREDFCALASGGGIHVVCQDKNGSILYLFLEQGIWRKIVLLENKEGKVYPKHFQLLSVGGFLNLFYTIIHKEKHLLVHQIITTEDRPPMVVDTIRLGKPPFWVYMHSGTDVTVLYDNASGVSGCRLYRWSGKTFGRFMPIHPSENCMLKNVFFEPNGKEHYAAFKQVEGFYNLVYFTQQDDTFTEPVTVYLDCPLDASPIFSYQENKQYLVWQESGGIMSARFLSEKDEWSKPVRYMIPSGSKTVLYCISNGGSMRFAYGYEKGQDIMLYGADGLQEPKEETNSPSFRPAGYEVEAFANSMSGEEKEEMPFQTDPMLVQVREELARIKEQLFRLRVDNKELQERLEKVETTLVPLAEEDVVDEVLLSSEG